MGAGVLEARRTSTIHVAAKVSSTYGDRGLMLAAGQSGVLVDVGMKSNAETAVHLFALVRVQSLPQLRRARRFSLHPPQQR